MSHIRSIAQFQSLADMARDVPSDVLTEQEVSIRLHRAQGGKSLKAARELFKAYRAACKGTGEDADKASGGAGGPETIASGEACHQLLQGTLSSADAIFRGLLESGRVRADKPPKRWHKVEPLARSYFGNSITLLHELADSSAQAFVLRCIAASADVLATCSRISKKFVRKAVQIWSEGEPTARVQAILLLRRLALYLPSDGLDEVLRRAYKAFAAHAKRVNRHNMEHIAFMTACLTELHALDFEASYAHAFTGIRGLAQLLRNALVTKSQESLQAVYSWQFLCCCEVWERIISKNGGTDESSPLRHMIYPLSQVIFGALRLLPSSRYAPLRLKLLRMLQRLGSNTNCYLPVAAPAADMLAFNELGQKPMTSRSSTEADMVTALKVPKVELRASYFQEYVVHRVLSILADHLEQWAYHPAFPELCHIPLKRLRRFVKTTPNPGFRRKAQSLVAAAERTNEWVARRRDDAEFAPRDMKAVEAFLADERAKAAAPLHKQAASIREHVRQQELAMTASDITVSAMGGAEAKDERETESLEPDFASRRTNKQADGAKNSDAEGVEDDADEEEDEHDPLHEGEQQEQQQQSEMPEEGVVEELQLSDDEEENAGMCRASENDDVDYEEGVLGRPVGKEDDAVVQAPTRTQGKKQAAKVNAKGQQSSKTKRKRSMQDPRSQLKHKRQ